MEFKVGDKVKLTKNWKHAGPEFVTGYIYIIKVVSSHRLSNNQYFYYSANGFGCPENILKKLTPLDELL